MPQKRSPSDDFLWRDWWLGVYRRGFGLYREADPRARRSARRSALLVTLALVPLLVFLAETLTSRADEGSFHYQLALDALARGDTETGLSELRQSVRKSPSCLTYRLRLGWELFKARLLAEAAGEFARVIPARPGFIGFLLAAAFISYYGSVVAGLYWRSKALRRHKAPGRL